MVEEILIKKIKQSDTMPKLDNLREDVVKMMMLKGQSKYQEIQKVFIKQKNKLLRIPAIERNW